MPSEPEPHDLTDLAIAGLRMVNDKNDRLAAENAALRARAEQAEAQEWRPIIEAPARVALLTRGTFGRTEDCEASEEMMIVAKLDAPWKEVMRWQPIPCFPSHYRTWNPTHFIEPPSTHPEKKDKQ